MKRSRQMLKLDKYEEEIKEDLLVHKASIAFLKRRYLVSEPTITKWMIEKGIRQ
jgi:hypothetical protein